MKPEQVQALLSASATLADFYRAALARWRDEQLPDGRKLIDLRKESANDTEAGRKLADLFAADVDGEQPRARAVRAALEEFVFEASPVKAAHGDPVSERWATTVQWGKEGDIATVRFPSKLDAIKLLAAHVAVQAMAKEDKPQTQVQILNVMDTALERLRMAGMDTGGVADELRAALEARVEDMSEEYSK